MVGNGQRASDWRSHVDMTTFLVIDRVARFADCFYYFLTGKGGDVCPSYLNGDKGFFHTLAIVVRDTITGKCAQVQFDGFGNIFLRLIFSFSL